MKRLLALILVWTLLVITGTLVSADGKTRDVKNVISNNVQLKNVISNNVQLKNLDKLFRTNGG